MEKKLLHCVYTRTDSNCFVWTVIDCETNKSDGEHWWMKYSDLCENEDEMGDEDTDYNTMLEELYALVRKTVGCDDIVFTALYTD